MVNIMGKPISKPVLFIGSGVVVVGGVLIYRKMSAKKAAAAAAAAASTSATAPVSNVSVYPSTSAYGMSAYGGYGGYAGYGGYPMQYGQSLYPGTGVPSVTPPITTNSEWAQAAAQYLENSGGMAANSVLDALGNGLTGAYLSPAQLQIWDQAVAIEGEPPQGHPPLNTKGPGGSGNPGYQAYAPGGQTLAQLAVLDKTTYAALAKANPGVARKYMGKPLPKGTGYRVPAGSGT